VLTTRRVLPVAVLVALGGAAVSSSLWGRLACVGFALLAVAAAWWQKRARPQLLVDEAGYAVEEHGREKLRVAWSEVVRVRADVAEHALYVDCGDPTRNLLVPPRRGYGFRFERAEALFARVVAAVGRDKVETVARLDAATPPAKAP
jgi:hypothetical protein